ncbi:hypothetical protein ACVJBD_001450 [Rhizobium mongolense]
MKGTKLCTICRMKSFRRESLVDTWSPLTSLSGEVAEGARHEYWGVAAHSVGCRSVDSDPNPGPDGELLDYAKGRMPQDVSDKTRCFLGDRQYDA